MLRTIAATLPETDPAAAAPAATNMTFPKFGIPEKPASRLSVRETIR